jgi:hypothetical protein
MKSVITNGQIGDNSMPNSPPTRIRVEARYADFRLRIAWIFAITAA